MLHGMMTCSNGHTCLWRSRNKNVGECSIGTGWGGAAGGLTGARGFTISLPWPSDDPFSYLCEVLSATAEESM